MNNLDPNQIQTALFADCLTNSEAIFQLMDKVFPVDSCRHYEVLPLSLVGKDLTVGILDPNNEESLKFVNSIVNVYKYNLTWNLIDRQTYQIILANYPSESSQQSRKTKQRDRDKTVIDDSLSNEAIPLSQAQRDRRRLADSAPTIISVPDEVSSADRVSYSGLENLPPDLDFLRDLELTPRAKVKSKGTANDSTATLYEIPPEFLNGQGKNNLDDKPTIIGGDPAELLAQDRAEIADDEAQISALIAEIQSENAAAKPETEDFLPSIRSQLSWQKLLETAFQHHTQQINLTRYSDRGGIVAFKNEDCQSSIEQLPLPTFCSLIDEIKRMARLPQDTSSHPKKVVLERIYEQERILLRLQFTAEEEEETKIVIVQILRDRELEIYEQKQMDRVSEQALHLAQQLERTLRKIQACFDSAQMTNLKELQMVQSRINHQLRLLDKIQ